MELINLAGLLLLALLIRKLVWCLRWLWCYYHGRETPAPISFLPRRTGETFDAHVRRGADTGRGGCVMPFWKKSEDPWDYAPERRDPVRREEEPPVSPDGETQDRSACRIPFQPRDAGSQSPPPMACPWCGREMEMGYLSVPGECSGSGAFRLPGSFGWERGEAISSG